LVAVMCATVLAACGSSHKSAAPTTTAGTPSTSTTVPGAAATPPPSTGPSTTSPAPNPGPTTTVPAPAAAAGNGPEYLAIVTPLTSSFESAPADPTRSQLEQLASEVTAAQVRLSAFYWPGQAETDIRTLVNELTPLASELAQGDAGAVNSTTGTLTSASVTIKFDLGLPSPR